MNTRFEPDSIKAFSWVSNLLNFNKNKEPPKNEKDLVQYIEDKMKESFFSINSKIPTSTYEEKEIDPQSQVKKVKEPQKKINTKTDEPKDSTSKNIIEEENE